MFPGPKPQVKTGHFKASPPWRWPLVLGVLLGFVRLYPGYTPAERSRFEATFVDERAQWLATTNDHQHAWHFARASYDWADAQTSNRERARIAQLGIDAAQSALALRPGCAEGHYFLALNLGQLAQTKTLGALKLVVRIEEAFLAARAADEQFDQAGADRGLGVLYLEAPGWPTSVGNRDKARKHLERAVELVPSHPGNRLALADALIQWREPDAARLQLDALDRDWPANRLRLSGPQWDADWRVWQARRDALAARFKLPPTGTGK